LFCITYENGYGFEGRGKRKGLSGANLLYLGMYDMSGTYKLHRGHTGNTCNIFVSKTETMNLLGKPKQKRYYWYKN
jgi:hypothetical protein